jgi:hypothetical protein
MESEEKRDCCLANGRPLPARHLHYSLLRAGSTLTIDYGNFAFMTGYQLRIENSLGQQVFQTNISQQSDTLSLGTWGGNGLYVLYIVDPQQNIVAVKQIVLQ